MKKIALLGHDNTSLAVILDIIHKTGYQELEVEIISNMDESKNSQRQFHWKHPVLEARVLHWEEWAPDSETMLLAASMSSKARFAIYSFFKENFSISDPDFMTLIHPFSDLAYEMEAAPGVIINPGVIVAPYTRLDRFVYLNRNCSIGHHSHLEEFVSVNPGAIVNGKTHIGAHTVIGAGAVIRDGIRIGKHSIVGAGAVVVKDLPEGIVAVGNPARIFPKKQDLPSSR